MVSSVDKGKWWIDLSDAVDHYAAQRLQYQQNHFFQEQLNRESPRPCIKDLAFSYCSLD